jgi:hypothetical protein
MGVEMYPELLREVVNPWLLGADPEFAVMEPPSKLIPNAGEYAVATAAICGSIGQDHGGRVWEVRLAPSRSSYAVVTNIWKCLSANQLEKVTKFKWKGGALGAPKNTPTTTLFNEVQPAQATPAPTYDTLGGHVHFGLASFSGPQKSALDKLTTTLLNLEILPSKENTTRISYGNYGKFHVDAVRECLGHIEYRCAPSWLDKPGQAFAALTSYKLAAAKPTSVDWTGSFQLKTSFLDWLSGHAQVDVDAWLLDRLIGKHGFESIQADPESNFRPRWRRENIWERSST